MKQEIKFDQLNGLTQDFVPFHEILPLAITGIFVVGRQELEHGYQCIVRAADNLDASFACLLVLRQHNGCRLKQRNARFAAGSSGLALDPPPVHYRNIRTPRGLGIFTSFDQIDSFVQPGSISFWEDSVNRFTQAEDKRGVEIGPTGAFKIRIHSRKRAAHLEKVYVTSLSFSNIR